jgi:preprotein translocase subunit SecE
MIVKDNTPLIDWVKWAAAFALFSMGLALNYEYAEVAVALRVIAWIFLAALVIACVVWTEKGKRFYHFLRESRREMRKVHWPTRQETVQTTIVVMVVVAIFSLILWGEDSIFMSLIAWITGQRG